MNKTMKEKERILVMNGSRILQIEKDGQWANGKVTRAGSLKPGIYNLYSAESPDPTKTHTGTILHADKHVIYQAIGKKIVKHDTASFGDDKPDVGEHLSVRYIKGQAQTSPAEKIKHSLSR